MIEWDFRYKDTLRLNFERPYGVGSNGLTNEELELNLDWRDAEYMIDAEIEVPFLLLCNQSFDEINEMLLDKLSLYKEREELDLDWRDPGEIEIHGIDQNKFDDSIIPQINIEIKEIIKTHIMKIHSIKDLLLEYNK
jgi:hypothetical protein